MQALFVIRKRSGTMHSRTRELSGWRWDMSQFLNTSSAFFEFLCLGCATVVILKNYNTKIKNFK